MKAERHALVEDTLGEIENLPTLPHIVVQLLDKMHEKNPKIEELADLIMTDQVLTTQMISLVNSAFWGLNREVTSIRESVVYLGLRQVENLIYSVSLTNTFEQDAPLLKRVRFWEHSFGVALCSRLIAQRLRYPDEEMAYLAGLLHDIGEVILALYLHPVFKKVVEKVVDEKISFCAAEEAILGFNHTDVGSWLVSRWKLPPGLSAVISHHHNIQEATQDPLLVGMVRMADLICLYHKLDFGIAESESVIPEILSTWQYLGGTFPKLQKIKMKPFLQEFNQQIELVKGMVRAVYTVDV
ncbi:HDOD domain-containing protein [bacterium]|nr:HDOD domain-containing protein [bacterium]